MNKALLQQALDAIEELRYSNTTHAADTICDATIAALHAELAKPEQAPVAIYRYSVPTQEFGVKWLITNELSDNTPLYLKE